ncbi:hypothetical protein GCM10027614_42260 [Micromonospora vulcania]
MNLLDELRTHRLLAIVRGPDPAAALTAVLTLAESGVALVEVSLTSTDALGIIRSARAALGPDFALGAGTVLSVGDARAAADAGAGFLVTPALAPSLAEAGNLGLPVLAGALTPTEVVQASSGGATAVKLFPASSAGPTISARCATRSPAPPSYRSAASTRTARGVTSTGERSRSASDPAAGRRRPGRRPGGPARTCRRLPRGGRAVTDLLTLGETMAAFRTTGPLRLGGTAGISVAGSESTVAIGLARLGHRAAWVGVTGADEPGELIRRTLRAEGVDLTWSRVDAAAPTGLILFESRVADINRVTYHRAGSAGSRLRPADVNRAFDAPGPPPAWCTSPASPARWAPSRTRRWWRRYGSPERRAARSAWTSTTGTGSGRSPTPPRHCGRCCPRSTWWWRPTTSWPY